MEKLKLSYSKLSEFDRKGARALIDRVDNKSLALTKGSLVNDLLFDVDITKDYVIKMYEDPTATTLKLANIIISNYSEVPSESEILELVKINEFWKNTSSDESKIKNFNKPEFWEYLDVNMIHQGKMFITPDRLSEAEEIVSVLKTHPHSRNIFRQNTIVPEFSFKIEYNDVILRGIIDIVHVDHDLRTIRFIDLKTGGGTQEEFGQSFVKWRYYLQEAVYMIAADTVKKELGLEDYELLNFQFLYIGLKEKLPVIFDVDDTWHTSALNGFTTKSGYEYKGLNQLIEECKYHHKFKVYDIPYELCISQGISTLKSNTIEAKQV